ncbi:hypothetical protein P7C70_g1018, partial [Phenoliferia sp. Uapishka_3]
MSPIKLNHLTLFPIPLETVPATDSAEHATLCAAVLAEANLIFQANQWSSPKSHAQGLVQTSSLPLDATFHDHVEPDLLKKKKPLDDSIGWHLRTSTFPADDEVEGGVEYKHFWEGLGERHAEQEAEYMKSLKIVSLPNSCCLKIYNLPFPTTNRSFLVHVVVIQTTPVATTEEPTPLRSFAVITLPVYESTPIKEDKGNVRGSFVAVDKVKEVRNSEGDLEVVWTSISQSAMCGSMPTSLAERNMPGNMASQVALFNHWLMEKWV